MRVCDVFCVVFDIPPFKAFGMLQQLKSSGDNNALKAVCAKFADSDGVYILAFL